MKRISIIFPVLLFFICAAMQSFSKRKIVFFGDSITQMGVNKGGYIDLLKDYVADKGWAEQYELLGAGIGGNKVYDLYLRLEEDVLAKDPTDVLIYVGINDVWHKTSGIGTDIVKYEQFYEALIRKMQAKNIRLFLCTPSVIGEKKTGGNPQDADLDAYSEVIRKLAAKYNCTLIDLRKTFVTYEERYNSSDSTSGVLTTDQVHLNSKGNQLVADTMKAYLFK
ncbi:MAG: GDSL-type esterase/lipase family protein [Ferruginibacter sp.]